MPRYFLHFLRAPRTLYRTGGNLQVAAHSRKLHQNDALVVLVILNVFPLVCDLICLAFACLPPRRKLKKFFTRVGFGFPVVLHTRK